MDHTPGFLAHVEGRRPGVHEVTVADTLQALKQTPGALLIDVREDREWSAGHAQDALHIARGVVERDIERLVPDPTTPLYLYCGGGFRSLLTAASLQEMGYTQVRSVIGGWRSWQDHGAPVELPPGAAAGATVSAARTVDMATEEDRYPIGRFQRPVTVSIDERASNLARIMALPVQLSAAISGFDARDYASAYRPGGWTVRQLIHHIADSHANAYIRVKGALTELEPTIKPYDQDAWVQLADIEAVSPLVSLAMLTAVHERLSVTLASLSIAHFSRTLIHPESGVMTLDQLVALYAWHGDHHLHHLLRFRSRRDASH